MKKMLFFLVLTISIVSVLNANIITVDLAGGGDYLTIHEAVTASSSGDSILVMSGQYDFTSSLGVITVSKELYLIGSGFDKVENGGTKLVDITNAGFFISDATSDNTYISGFRMVSGSGTCIVVQDNSKNIVIENNYFVTAGWGLSMTGCQKDTIRSNIFYSTNGINISGTTDDAITNNLFVGKDAGYTTGAKAINSAGISNLLISNNIFLKHGDTYVYYGSYRATVTLGGGDANVYSNVFLDCHRALYDGSSAAAYITNNCFYNNSENGDVGQNSLLADPLFVNFSSGSSFDENSVDDDEYDFHLDTGSPCIDGGRIGPAYADTDGSTSDIGMYGGSWPFMNDLGIPAIPEVISISVSPSSVSPGGTITITAKGRIGTGSTTK